MTMVRQLRWPAVEQIDGRFWVARTVAVALWVCLATSLVARGQDPGMHYRHGGMAPPGAIGSVQLQRGGPLPGYFQPVEIRAPRGAQISMAVNGAFDAPQATPLRIGLLIAPVYRLKVSNLPGRGGEEVFPTIELIDRIYPPRGQERRFPVPIELTEEDLRLALEGKYVTRVIYLEDPDLALPVAQQANQQEWFDAGPGVNPVEEADRWGRPLAILRIGGRVPDDRRGPDMTFLGGCPPFTFFRPWAAGEESAALHPDLFASRPRSARPMALNRHSPRSPALVAGGFNAPSSTQVAPALVAGGAEQRTAERATFAERKATDAERKATKAERKAILPAAFRRLWPAGGRR